MKSTFKRNFRLFPLRSGLMLKKQTLLSSKKTFSGVMFLYSVFPPPLAEAPSNEMNSP